jgi:uncharacterized metal-binding protein
MSENSEDTKYVFYACSGASNVGEIADKTARKLRSTGVGLMSCLSGVGANLPNYIEIAKNADFALVIDGCPVKCGQTIFRRAGLDGKFFELSNFGLEKGKTQITDQVIEETAKKIKEQL